MDPIIKRLTIENAELFVTVAGRRTQLADFAGEIVITEREVPVSILGRPVKEEKEIRASFVLCQDISYCKRDRFSTAKAYDAVGMVHGDREAERLTFSGLRFDDLDPITGELRLEITELGSIQRMLLM